MMELLFHGGVVAGNGDQPMDATRCQRCNTRMKAVAAEDGRTDLKCLKCDKVDPLHTDAVKWADGPLAQSKVAYG
jgi:phage FluMu protein Com